MKLKLIKYTNLNLYSHFVLFYIIIDEIEIYVYNEIDRYTMKKARIIKLLVILIINIFMVTPAIRNDIVPKVPVCILLTLGLWRRFSN